MRLAESSTATMTMTNNEYSTFTTLLSASKALITTLERADFLDRLILLAALTFFGLVCVYVFKRRVVDKGVRVATALGNAVARKGKGREEVVEEVLAVTTAIVSTLLSIATILPSPSSTSIQHGSYVVQSNVENSAPLAMPGRRGAQNGKMGRVERVLGRVPRAPPAYSPVPAVESFLDELYRTVEEAMPEATAVPIETQETSTEQVETPAEESRAPQDDAGSAASPLETVAMIEKSEEVEEESEESPTGFVESIVDEIRSALPDFIVETPSETAVAVEEPADDPSTFSAAAEPESEPTLDIPSSTPSATPILSPSDRVDETTTTPPAEPTESTPSVENEKNPKSRRFEGEAIDPALWSHESINVDSTAVEEREEATTTFEEVTTPIDLPTPTPVRDVPIDSLEEVVLTASAELLYPREDAVGDVVEVEEEIAIQGIDDAESSGAEVVDMEMPEAVIEMLEEDAAASNVEFLSEEEEPPAESAQTVDSVSVEEEATPAEEMGKVAQMEELMRETRASWAEIVSHTDPNELEPELLLKNHPVVEEVVQDPVEEEEENASPVIADEQFTESDFERFDDEEIPAPVPASTPTPTPLDIITDEDEEEEAPAATPASTPELEPILQADDLLASEAIADAEATGTLLDHAEESLFDLVDEEPAEAEAEIGGSLVSDPTLFAELNPFVPVEELDPILELETPDSGVPEHSATNLEADEVIEAEASEENIDEAEGATPVELVEERLRDEL